MLAPVAGAQTCTFNPNGQPDGWVPIATFASCGGLRPCLGVGLADCTVGPTSSNLPQFPAVDQPATYACYSNCVLLTTATSASIQIPALVVYSCDWYVPSGSGNITVTVNGETLTGPLNARYSRTWVLVQGIAGAGASAVIGQVWRFLVNAGLTATSTPTGCPVPLCASPTNPVHFVGHIDFACVNDGGDPNDPPGGPPTWRVALSLTHLPGVISHNAASTRGVAPGLDHPATSYHLVSPSGFTWISQGIAPVTGMVAGSRFRKDTQPGACAVTDVSIVTYGSFCLSDALCPGPSNWWDMTMGTPGNFLRMKGCTANEPWLRSEPRGAPWPGGAANPNAGIIGVALGDFAMGTVFPYSLRLSLFWGCVTYRSPWSPPGPYERDFVTGVGTEEPANQYYPAELFAYQLSTCCPAGPRLADFQNSRIEVDPDQWANLWGSLFTSDLVFSLALVSSCP